MAQSLKELSKQIVYSDRYSDEDYEYRYVPPCPCPCSLFGLSLITFCFLLQACYFAQGDARLCPEEIAADRDRVEESWSGAVARVGALHDPRARAPYFAVQAGEGISGQVRQQPEANKDLLNSPHPPLVAPPSAYRLVTSLSLCLQPCRFLFSPRFCVSIHLCSLLKKKKKNKKKNKKPFFVIPSHRQKSWGSNTRFLGPGCQSRRLLP